MAKPNPCTTCGGKCCRYFAFQIDEPTSWREYEDIRWYLCHENTRIFVEEGDWYIEIRNVCRHLDENSRCRIYPKRPAICREHSIANCEGTDAEFDRDFEFDNDAELARHMAKIFKPKKKKKKKQKKGKGNKEEKGKKDKGRKGKKGK